MNVKRIVALVFLLIFVKVSTVFAQPWLTQPLPSADQPAKKANLYDISAQFEAYWKDKAVSVDENENAAEGGYQQFKRWEWFMKPRTYPSGNYFPSTILYDEYLKVRNKNVVSRTAGPNWSFIGPTVVPSNGGGVGRVNVIRFDPVNPSIIYVGTACGGIWISRNGGTSWTTSSDFLPSLSIADIAINPRYPDSIYVATGDGYGYENGTEFWGGLYSAGILVSADGGQTWNPTGWSRTQEQLEILQRLLINPANPNILLTCNRNGIFKSDDKGATWNMVKSGHFFDMEFRSGSSDTVYASNTSGLFRSKNKGLTWSQMSASMGGARTSIAVTAADPNVIYLLNTSGNLYRSSNGGTTFTQTLPPDTATTFYGYYDNVLGVSPLDANLVFCGGLNLVKSTDGGASWTVANSGNVHVDFHSAEFIPNTGTLYAGSDGGVFKTLNGGFNWTNLSNTLAIKQYYRISHSHSDPYLIYGGAQDNGTDRLKNGAWTHVFGGDGMDNAVNYNDENVAYVSYQYGEFSKTTNGGANFNSVAPASGGDWITPIILDPNNPDIVYIGYSDIYESMDAGQNWTMISNFGSSTNFIGLSSSGNGTVYAATISRLYVTHNDGQTWNDITSGLPSLAITRVTSSTVLPNTVYVTFSGYTPGEKVYYSNDGGTRWINISTGIANIPANCVAINEAGTDDVFVGTDLGIYYSSAGSDFVPYGNGLPNVIVEDLDIDYSISKIRAATYGRGIWEANINVINQNTLDAAVISVQGPSATLCDPNILPAIGFKNFGSAILTSLTIYYGLDGDTSNVYTWTGSLAQNATSSILLPSLTAASGVHTLTIYCALPNGGVDQNTANDLRSISFSINTTGVSIPVAEGFESNDITSLSNFDLTNSGQLAQRAHLGGFGLSAYSLIGSNFTSPGGSAFLTSKNLNLTTAIRPFEMTFNYAYAQFSSAYHDSLFVRVSTDCGVSYTTVFAKGDDSLATALSTTSNFLPVNSDWKNVVLNLSAFAGTSNVMVQFEIKSGFGNNVYIDDINLSDNFNQLTEFSTVSTFTAFPNPFTDELNVAFNAQSSHRYTVTLLDIEGRMITEKQVQGSGFNKVLIPGAELERGVYLVRLSDGAKVVGVQKLVK